MGSVRVTNTGAYQFYVQSGLPLRLFINDRLVLHPWKAELEQTAAALLRAGERCELRLELRATNTAAPVKLSWSGPGFAKTLLSQQHLSPGAGAAALASGGSSAVLPAGVVLTGGVTVDAPVQSATESAIRFKGIFSARPLPLAKVSHIIVKPLTAELAAAIPKGRTGVLLKNRDFIDGEFAGIQNGQLKIGSVLFGTRTFDLAKDVLAVVLRARELLPWRYTVVARDGTVLYGSALAISPGQIAFAAAIEYRLPLSELIEVCRRSEDPAP
jgi:hypothetical protein